MKYLEIMLFLVSYQSNWGRQEWKDASDQNLQNDLAEQWNQYTLQLNHSALKLSNMEDELKSSKKQRIRSPRVCS